MKTIWSDTMLKDYYNDQMELFNCVNCGVTGVSLVSITGNNQEIIDSF